MPCAITYSYDTEATGQTVLVVEYLKKSFGRNSSTVVQYYNKIFVFLWFAVRSYVVLYHRTKPAVLTAVAGTTRVRECLPHAAVLNNRPLRGMESYSTVITLVLHYCSS